MPTVPGPAGPRALPEAGLGAGVVHPGPAPLTSALSPEGCGPSPGAGASRAEAGPTARRGRPGPPPLPQASSSLQGLSPHPRLFPASTLFLRGVRSQMAQVRPSPETLGPHLCAQPWAAPPSLLVTAWPLSFAAVGARPPSPAVGVVRGERAAPHDDQRRGGPGRGANCGAPGARVSSPGLSRHPSLASAPRLGTLLAVLGSQDQQSRALPHTQATVASTQQGPRERGAGGDPDRAQCPPRTPLLQALLGAGLPPPGP